MARSLRTAGLSTSVGNGCFEDVLNAVAPGVGHNGDSARVTFQPACSPLGRSSWISVRETRRDCSPREALIGSGGGGQPYIFVFGIRSYSSLNFVYYSGVMMPLACSVYLASLASVQPRLHVPLPVHLLPLLGRKIEVGQRNGAGHLNLLLLILNLQHPFVVFARQQDRCPKSYPCHMNPDSPPLSDVLF
jgi:hypothetical protein